MSLSFRKVYPEDYALIEPLLKKISDNPIKFMPLFFNRWKSKESFVGVAAEQQGNVKAFLGLVFSDREINGRTLTFCNLTTLIIDESLRGQKLSYKIIEFVKSLGDFVLTAITPIPSLYNMYESQGFKRVNDFRTIFWRMPLPGASSGFKLISLNESANEILTQSERKILADHLEFNCLTLLFQSQKEHALLILKPYSAQRRKFITQRFLNYSDYAMRKIFNYSFLDTVITPLEVHYCSNYPFLLANIKAFAAHLFTLQEKIPGFFVRTFYCERFKNSYPLKNNFWHSRQLYFSEYISEEQFDTLYSEIFLLDL
ncbi:MAG: hypothetical protein RMJ53_04005 [Chitinophagales bacterium]|nr:hypothetical protein [Chitinophagales bacterium]MDW8273378.1 hypothetical protein [Chitinophagales bacterium]